MEIADTPQAIPASALRPGMRFDWPLFHRDGTVMVLARAAVDEALVRALREAGIDEVYGCRNTEAVGRLRERGELTEVDLASLHEGVPVSRNVYDEAGELVCPRGQPLTNAILGDLVRRGVARLYEERSPYEAVRERFDAVLASAVAETLEKRAAGDTSLLRIEPGLEPFSESCGRPKPAERTRHLIEAERKRHALGLATTHGLLERVRREGLLDLPAAREIVEEIVERFAADMPLTLAFAETALHSDYLVDHSFAVATHVVAMGIALGYDRSQCAELGLGGLLHDVGMARVRENVLNKQTPLTPDELAEIRAHPKVGLDLLRAAPGVSMPLPFAVYQDHERVDGRGYPLGQSNGWIHDHSKLIAVADVYQAMTSPRPYKPRKTPQRALRQILRMVQDQTLDPAAVKAFLATHGAYPVGSWVLLSDNRVARVVEAKGDPYDRPLVTALTDPLGAPAVPEVVDLASGEAATLRIVESVDPAALGSGRSDSPATGAELVTGDFAAGFHLEPPAGAAPAHVPTRAAPDDDEATRKVPAKYLDWSASFSGHLSDFGVVDLVQILDVSQKSGVLLLRFHEAYGQVKMSDGEIMSAELVSDAGETVRDEEALYKMVAFTEGSFRFEQAAVERRKTVKLNNATILMEACRLQDEAELAGGSAG
ncbi:MAG: HD domain-containing phosphohydrolase [Planctomycetota bacterium]